MFSHGVRAADALGDQAAEARQINCLTWAFSVGAGDYRQAEQHARRTLALARAAGDLTQQAWACGYLAAAMSSDGRLEEAVETIEEAVRLFKATTDRVGTAVAQRVQGTVLRRAGRPREALAVHRSLVDSTSGDAPGFTESVQAILRFEVAQDLMALGEWHEAVTEFRAVTLPDTHRGAERFRGNALRGLAEALEHCGELSEARKCYTQARPLYQAAGAVDDMTRIDEALARLEAA